MSGARYRTESSGREPLCRTRKSHPSLPPSLSVARGESYKSIIKLQATHPTKNRAVGVPPPPSRHVSSLSRTQAGSNR